jgi:hypothetical protein
MPDLHSGYGVCIGNVAALDLDDPDAIASPGGVGFDINCGVRLIRTNLNGRLSGRSRFERTCARLSLLTFQLVSVEPGLNTHIYEAIRNCLTRSVTYC